MAALDLDDAVVRAPLDGMVSRMRLQPGEWLEEGEPAFSIINPATIWIEANLKETQLEHVEVGQQVEIEVDAYPGQRLARRGRQHQPRDRRRVRPDPAAERDRQLGQGGAAAAGADRGRSRREDQPPLRAGMTVTVSIDTEREPEARRAGQRRARRGPGRGLTAAAAAPPRHRACSGR